MKITFKTRGNSEYLYYRITHERVLDATRKLPIIIPNISDFNSKKQSFNNDSETNKELIDFTTYLKAAFKDAVENQVTLSVSWLQKTQLDYFNPTNECEDTLLSEYIITYLEREASLSTKSKIKAVHKKVSSMQPVKITGVDIQWLNTFYNFITKNGLSATTANKHCSIIKQMVRSAMHKEMNIKQSVFGWKPKKEEIITHYLDNDELEILFNFKTLDPSLENIRRLALIGATTGLRYSDLSRINTFEIRNGLLMLTVTKTGQKLAVPIHKKVEWFIGKVYPIESQSFNKGIKKLCKEAGIDNMVDGYVRQNGERVYGLFPKYKLISSHSLRRSFATNLYGELPSTLIMAITGHKKESSFLKYIRKPQIDSALQLKEYYNKMH